MSVTMPRSATARYVRIAGDGISHLARHDPQLRAAPRGGGETGSAG